jgi:ribosome maturation factor RimP
MPSPLTNKIIAAVLAPVEGAGYELVDLEFKREQAGWVCRVYLDRQDGQAISLEDCERMSRELGPVLDVADIIPQAYALEVSSPGLDRPLKTAAHFKRFVGEKARVKLGLGVDGRRNFAGVIVGVTDESGTAAVELDVDGKHFTLPLSDLDKANLIYDFDRDKRQ